MPATLVLEADWSRGLVSDAPRAALPQGAFYDAQDYLFHEPARAQKRGGTSYAGPALAGAAAASVVAYAEYPSGAQLLSVGDNGHLYRVTAGSTTDISSLGAQYLSIDTPKFRVGAGKRLLILTANDGTSLPKVYDGSTVTTLSSSAPPGKYAAIYKGRIALGGTDANEDRIYFGPVPDITSAWDTTEAWINTDFPLRGLAALQNALLIFSERKLQRITGSTPPPGTDFDRQPLFDIGCSDARSIVVYEGRALFANPNGVFATDGASYRNLTREAGINREWQALFDTGTNISSGTLSGYLFVCVTDADNQPVGTLMCNLVRNAWWPLTNINARMFASAVGVQNECYYADSLHNRVLKLSGILDPDATNKNDADGTAVEPMLETRALGAGPTLKQFTDGHLTYDMRDAASDDPSLSVSFAPGLEASTFTEVRESPFAETTDARRVRLTFGKVTQGGSLRISQTGASSKTEIFAIEALTRPLPFQAGGQ